MCTKPQKTFYSRNVRTIRVGDAGIFIMNAEGRIAAFKNDESQSFMLAYLTAASPGEGVDSDIIKSAFLQATTQCIFTSLTITLFSTVRLRRLPMYLQA